MKSKLNLASILSNKKHIPVKTIKVLFLFKKKIYIKHKTHLIGTAVKQQTIRR